MLRAAGFTVDLVETNNDAITTNTQKVRTAALVSYSLSSRRAIAEHIGRLHPDIVHVHNFFPILTPSVYDACRTMRVPVVQTLHNYRLVCANALLFLDGKVCTECIGHIFPLSAIFHGCYRGSRLGSAAVAAMIGGHRIRHTWTRRVSRFIALTGFARSLFAAEVPIPEEQIAIKPNAVPDPGLGDGRGGFALYVGRLSQEKGIGTLLDATGGEGLGITLKIAGSGPLQSAVEAAQVPGKVEYLGQLAPEGVRGLMRDARLLLIPSLCYEGLPMVVPEAFGSGLPIIASRIGSLQTLIEDGGDGLLVEPGNPTALVQAVRRITADDRFETWLRSQARRTYEAIYRPDANVRLLMEIYEQALREMPALMSA